MTEDRWDRLAKDLQDAGFEVRLDRTPYAESHYGRVQHGVSSSIIFRVPGKGCVEIDSKHGRGGKWYGWTVTATAADSICIGRPSWATTKRSEAVAAFRTAVTRVQERAA